MQTHMLQCPCDVLFKSFGLECDLRVFRPKLNTPRYMVMGIVEHEHEPTSTFSPNRTFIYDL